jgi:hypothetical protein
VVATVGQGELRPHARRVSMKTVPVADLYYRVADPDRADPLDPSFAAAGAGQRRRVVVSKSRGDPRGQDSMRCCGMLSA